MSEPEKVIPIHRREDQVKAAMLTRLENLSSDLANKQDRLTQMGDSVLEMVEEAIRDRTITPYRAAVAHGKCVESMVRVANVQMGLYDRLAGTVGLFGKPIEEEEEGEKPDMSVQREAEAILLEVVKQEIAARREAKQKAKEGA